MPINSKKIPVNVLIGNRLYKQFHEETKRRGQTKTGVIRNLLQDYVDGKGIRPEFWKKINNPKVDTHVGAHYWCYTIFWRHNDFSFSRRPAYDTLCASIASAAVF